MTEIFASLFTAHYLSYFTIYAQISKLRCVLEIDNSANHRPLKDIRMHEAWMISRGLMYAVNAKPLEAVHWRTLLLDFH